MTSGFSSTWKLGLWRRASAGAAVKALALVAARRATVMAVVSCIVEKFEVEPKSELIV